MPRAGSHAVERQLDLTPRQREVIALMSAGRTNFDIARELGLSLEGAKYHVSEILARLQVSSREEAVAAWRDHQRPAARLARGLAAIGIGRLALGGGIAIAAAGVATVAAIVIASSGGDDTPASDVAPTSTPQASATPSPDATPSPLPTATPTKGPDVRWRWDSGELQAQVWLAGTRGVLVASVARRSFDGFVLQPGYVAVIDDATGAERWRFATPSQPYPAAATADAVVFGTADGMVYGLDQATGAELWRVSFPGVPFAVADAGAVVIVADADPAIRHPTDWGAGLFADTSRLAGRAWGLDPETGEVRWQVQLGDSTVFVAQDVVGSASIPVLAASSGRIARLDVRDGAVAWQRDLNRVTSPPVLANDIVVVPGAELTALELDDGTPTWSVAPSDTSYPYVFPANSKTHVIAAAGKWIDAYEHDGEQAWRVEGLQCATGTGTSNVVVPGIGGLLLGWLCGSGLWLIEPASASAPVVPWFIPQGAVDSVVVTAGGIAMSSGIGTAPVQVLGLAAP